MKKQSVFISYNFHDSQVANQIAMFIAAEGISVWMDKWQLRAGDSIVGGVSEGLDGCSHFFLLWSFHSSKSNWVKKEMQSALSKAIQIGSPRVIPVLLDEEPLPALLHDIMHIRYAGEIAEDQKLIVECVKGLPPNTTFIRAVVQMYRRVTRGSNEQADPHKLFDVSACLACGSSNLGTGVWLFGMENVTVLERIYGKHKKHTTPYPKFDHQNIPGLVPVYFEIVEELETARPQDLLRLRDMIILYCKDCGWSLSLHGTEGFIWSRGWAGS